MTRIASASISTPFGRAETSRAARAGYGLSKYSSITSLIAEKSFKSVRKIVS